jgi:hypothetical protein
MEFGVPKSRDSDVSILQRRIALSLRNTPCSLNISAAVNISPHVDVS